ncbi:short-chain dehydrogenase/reductase [Xylaria scruposa]|nr:short-chain dehydrogenase/reductase [Xylaria scruposa]
MSENTITATETRPGGPPADLNTKPQNTKLRWGTKNPPADPKVSFAGKTVLVTGANTGLGFQAAQKYAALGAERLILGVRSQSKGEAAKEAIMNATGYSKIDILTVDLTSFDSTQAFVEKLEKLTNKLDVALLNAGLGNPTYQKSASGWEMAIQVNVLSTALMAVLLLPILRSTAAQGQGKTPHLTFVNSNGHDLAKREWLGPDGSLLQAANKEKGWVSEHSYSMVKLAGMAVMQHIAKVTANTIIVNAVCPGLCKTELGRNFNVVQRTIGNIVLSFIARTAEQGSRTLVSGTALGPESHGRFWHNDVLYPIGEMAKDEALMRKTWDEVYEVISKDRPAVEKALKGDS